ncbi:MAG: co-chaperone GroES [Simkaniaceae bacterium]|nr:co-chaperone GroES [Simkaniaceae bacterium]
MTQQTKTKLKPVGYRVVVQRKEEEEKTQGGIILPDSAKKKPESALVVEVGSPKKTSEGAELPIPVKVGDTILMDKYAGQEVSIDDEDFVILKADDIIAIIEE